MDFDILTGHLSYMDFDILTCPLSVWECSYVEMVDNVCTRAYMQFDLICVHFSHMTDLKWIFSNVKINSEAIGGFVFPHTCTHLILNEQFLT